MKKPAQGGAVDEMQDERGGRVGRRQTNAEDAPPQQRVVLRRANASTSSQASDASGDWNRRGTSGQSRGPFFKAVSA